MTVKEDLVRDALLRSGPDDLDGILTAIEGYRTCIATAERLRRSPEMDEQREQALHCAQFCESRLHEFLETGQFRRLEQFAPDQALAHLRLTYRW